MKIETFDVDYVPNPNTKSKSGATSFQSFSKVRDSVLKASQIHGPTGPEDDGKTKPSFWIVEDQYNDDLYQIMDVYDVEKFSERFIGDIAASLKKHKGWAVAIGNFDKSKFLIFEDRILVREDKFGDCATLFELVRKAQAKADFKA
jgi:hypothetical protein